MRRLTQDHLLSLKFRKQTRLKGIYKENRVVVGPLHCDLDEIKKLRERLVKETLESGNAGDNPKLMGALQSLMASQKEVQQAYENLDWITHTHRIKTTNEPLTSESVEAAIFDAQTAMQNINDDCAMLKRLLPKKVKS